MAITANRHLPAQARRYAREALGAALALAALVGLYLGTDVVTALELRLYDAAAVSAAPRPLPEIAVIAIDEASLAHLGPWPWSHNLHAQLIDQLAAAGAKTIVHTTVFDAPQTGPGVRLPLPGLTLAEAGESAPAPVPAPAPDPDARLATSVQRAGNVLLAGTYVVGAGAALAAPAGAPPAPAQAHKSALPDPGAAALSAVPGQLPLDEFDHAAAGVGHMSMLADADGVVRSVPLQLRHGAAGVPSLALLAAAHSLHLGVDDVQRVPGLALRVGALTIPTHAGDVLRPHFYAPRQSQPAFAVDSFHAVLGGTVDASKYQGKVVLVGATAAALQAPVAVPGGQQWAPVQVLAHSISGIRQGHGYTVPAWGPQAMWMVLLFAGLHVVLGLPRWPVAVGAAITLGLLGVLCAVQAWLLTSAHRWQPLVLPMLVLLAGQSLHFLYRLRPVALARPLPDPADDRQAARARALQGGGRLPPGAPAPAQTVVYDAGRDVNEHSNMADFQKTVMDSAALPASVATPERGTAVAWSATP